jgi:TldD protein
MNRALFTRKQGYSCMRNLLLTCAVAVALCGAASGTARAADRHPLLEPLESELELSMDKLVGPDGSKPYFLMYSVTDTKSVSIAATLGALTGDSDSHSRQLDVDVRVGDYTLDSTRQIRDAGYGGFGGWGGAFNLPIDDNELATRCAIWRKTDERFKDAVKRLAQVKANLKVKVEEEDPSDDFSREAPSVHIEQWTNQTCDRAALKAKIKKYSERFRAHPEIYSSRVNITGNITNNIMVSSEGTRLQFGRGWWRIGINASTVAEDGMELSQYKSFDAHSPDGLPSDEEVLAAVDQVIADVLALREAKIVDPYTGPAILMNRATGVFFHEIFGHRMEGHRQKDVDEGQTFAKKLGKEVLPDFLSVVDDPTRRTFNGVDLNGYYQFDDEGVPAQEANLVENGILKTFLMSRSPARGINKSNGHGRRQPGLDVVARMGNTILESERTMPFDQLRQKLIDEVKKQGKEFGLIFDDISGGFTTTRRWSPQSFKVNPILVYRVYTDGRPDELVRGVDIVGTPLTSFGSIVATGDDPAIFNGVCGAESGSVPVSAIAPSILVEKIEIEKQRKSQDRPPILPAPIASENMGN